MNKKPKRRVLTAQEQKVVRELIASQPVRLGPLKAERKSLHELPLFEVKQPTLFD